MDLQKKINLLTGIDQTDDRVLSPKHLQSTFEDDLEDITDQDRFCTLEELSIRDYMRISDDESPKKSKKKKKHELFDDFEDVEFQSTEYDQATANKSLEKLKSSRLFQKITKKMSPDTISTFESFLDDENNFEGEDSEELKNNLISIGRKYARDTGVSGASSEIVKQYSDSEKNLKNLWEEFNRDAQGLQRDIEQLRSMTRGKNYKALSDLASAKTSIQSARLSVIKEMNAMRKTQFEMKLKEQAQKNATGEAATDITTNTIRNLFGSAHTNLVDAVGGYQNISGAVSDTKTIESAYSTYSDDEIDQKYFSNDTDEDDSDGDKFLKYEDAGVEYVLLVDDESKPLDLIAEDRDGNIVPDYPMPTNFRQLNFDINVKIGRATDDLHRQYKVRQV